MSEPLTPETRAEWRADSARTLDAMPVRRALHIGEDEVRYSLNVRILALLDALDAAEALRGEG